MVDRVAEAQWHEHEKQVKAAAMAHLELTMPHMRRAMYFRQRVEIKQAETSEKKEAEEALEAEASDSRPTDFNFAGEGRPFRFACGKASRVRGGREAVRELDSQMREGRLELAETDGRVRHSQADSPFGGLSLDGLLVTSQVRCPLRDFIVEWARDNAIHYSGKPGGWRDGGLRYTCLGCGELLFDLELLQRIRGLGIRVAQICLVDKAFKWPVIATMRALQEFTDFQRGAAALQRQEPTEVLAFGSIQDYKDQISDKAKGSHCLLHFDHYQEALLDEDDCDKIAMQVLCHGGLLARLSNVHSGMGFAAQAWALTPGGPSYQGGVDLSPIADPLLVACNDAISSPAVQMRVQVQQLAWAQQQKKEEPPPEVKEEKPRPTTKEELDALEEQAKEEDRAKGLSEAQVLARARMRVRERGSDGKVRSVRKTALQERAEHYGLDVWRVIYDPHVAVRAAPKGTARIVGQLDFGQEIMVSKEKKGHWLRISEGPITANLPTDAWVLVDASEGMGKAMMLEKVQ